MMGMAATIIFYAKVSEWQWHYNLALDSLYVMATTRFCLYVFFHRPLVVPLFSPLFDSTTLYLAVLVYMAHPPAPPPPQPVHQGSSESDPANDYAPADSSSFSSRAPDDDYALPTPAWRIDPLVGVRLVELIAPADHSYTKWPSFGTLGHRSHFLFVFLYIHDSENILRGPCRGAYTDMHLCLFVYGPT